MPRYRTNYTLAPPRPHLPPGFLEARDLFRASDFDLFAESTTRFIAKAGDETFGPWRTLREARDWLAARPAQRSARRAR